MINDEGGVRPAHLPIPNEISRYRLRNNKQISSFIPHHLSGRYTSLAQLFISSLGAVKFYPIHNHYNIFFIKNQKFFLKILCYYTYFWSKSSRKFQKMNKLPL